MGEQEWEAGGKKWFERLESNQCVSMATIQMEEQWKPKTEWACVCVCLSGGTSKSAERHNAVCYKKKDVKHEQGNIKLDFSRQIFASPKRRR